MIEETCDDCGMEVGGSGYRGLGLYTIGDKGLCMNCYDQCTIDGLSILKIELTEEELMVPVTMERICAYHYEVGETFLDQHESIVNHNLLCGFLLAKYPNDAQEIIYSSNFGGALDIHEFSFYENYDTDDNQDGALEESLVDFCEFVNLTVHSKKRINEILITVERHHGGDDD